MSYTRYLLDLVDKLNAIALERLRPAVEQEMARRQDAWADDLELLFDGIRMAFGAIASAASIRTRVTETARRVADHTGTEMSRQFRTVLGVDVVQTEPWLDAQLAEFRRENVKLITSLTDTHLQRIEQLVADNVRTGGGWKALAGDIEQLTGVTKNRAKLIAIDQIGKAQGRMTELRQRNLGIDAYEWSTAKDRRVRGRPGGAYPDAHPSHWAREGRTYRWSDPPEGGHPGEAIRCRCVAQPVIPEIDDLFT